MDQAAIARWRLSTLLIRDSDAHTPADVIGRLFAVQGQDFLPALWSVGQRTTELTPYDGVVAAFNRGELLRTHVLRPTWHLVAPADLPWLLTATGPRVHRANAYYYRRLGIDEQVMRTVRATLEHALAHGALTRADVARELSNDGVEASGMRLGYVMMWAEVEGWISSGPLAGKQQTYALLGDRAHPGWERQDALVELARRYFATRGPATVRDLASWASLTVTEARAARAELGDDVTDVRVDGRTYVVTGDPPDPGEDGAVHLVQQYDEAVMSFSESKDVLHAGHVWADVPAPTFVHAILLDGRVVGHWRYTRSTSGRPDATETFTYRPLDSDEQAALDEALARFQAFAG